MNINRAIWGELGIDPDAAYSDKRANIRAGILLIRRIQDRLSDPEPEYVATLYNSMAKEKVNDYGARVARYMQEKPWRKWDPLEESDKQTMSP